MSGKKSEESVISYGSAEEIHSFFTRQEGKEGLNLERLSEALEKNDPDGEESFRLAEKYFPEAYRYFLGLGLEGKLGEEIGDILRSIPEFGPVNLREKVFRLVQLTFLFVHMTLKERQELIANGGWKRIKK